MEGVWFWKAPIITPILDLALLTAQGAAGAGSSRARWYGVPQWAVPLASGYALSRDCSLRACSGFCDGTWMCVCVCVGGGGGGEGVRMSLLFKEFEGHDLSPLK